MLHESACLELCDSAGVYAPQLYTVQINSRCCEVCCESLFVRVWDAMEERQNTIVCAIDPSNQRITAYQIHDWIYESLRLPELGIRMI